MYAAPAVQAPDLICRIYSIGFAPLDSTFIFANIFRGCPPIVGAALVCGVQRKFVYFHIQIFIVRRFLFAQSGAIPKIIGADLMNLDQNGLFLAYENTGKLDSHAVTPKITGGFKT